MMTKYTKGFFAFLPAFALSISAHAAVPPAITTLMADVESVWGDVEGVIILIGSFLLIWGIVKKLRRA